MKVLLVNHFPLEGSGSGTYTKNIAHYLSVNGHEVCSIFPENTIPEEIPGVFLCPVYFSKDLSIQDALPYNFPCFTTHPRSNTTFADLNENQLNQYFAAFDKVISERIHNFRPDIIHVQHIWCLSYIVSKYDVPFVITTHGTDLVGYGKWPQFRVYAETAVDRCAGIIAISKDNYQSIQMIFPKAANKTSLMSNGYNNGIFYIENVDREELLKEYGIPYKGERIVLFAGKLTALKGVDILLNSAQEYEKLQPGNIITVIAGSGEQEEELKRLKESLKLSSVYFIGHRNQNELRRLYSNADIFAMPSRYEAFGLVALEAMACGLPIAASDVGGLSDFVKGEAGTLVDVSDAGALCKAILKEMLNAHDASRRFSIAGYASENYAQVNLMSGLEKIYFSVI